METQKAERDDHFRIPDALWEHTKAVLPVEPPKPQGGRPRHDDRHMLEAVFSVRRTGIPWKALPRCVGAGSSVHERLQAWRKAGVLRAMWAAGVRASDGAQGIDGAWPAMEGAMTKAPLGGMGTGPNPTDRAKRGTKRCVWTAGQGVPLAVVGDGANRNDMQMTAATLDAIGVERPEPTRDTPQHLA